jgi:enterochelin esterase-like enzyme
MSVERHPTARPRGRLAAAATCAALSAVTGCTQHRIASWEQAPLAPGQIETVRLADASDFQVERVRFFSEELGQPRFILVLTPAGGPAEEVLILNHGWADRPEDLLTSLGVDAAYAALLKAGAVARARLVLPDVRFSNAERLREARDPFKKYLTLVGQEIPDLVSRTYGIPMERTRWGIGGFSFGGYVALDVARRYPGRFGRASVISGFYDRDWTFWPSAPPPPGALDRRGRGRQTIVDPGPVPSLMLACGTGDRFIANMRELHDLLTRLGIAHEWSTAPGDHSWAYWKSVLRPLLIFHLPVRPRPAAIGHTSGGASGALGQPGRSTGGAP